MLDDIVLSTVRGVFLNITGGPDISLDEVAEIVKTVQEKTHEDAQILFGLVSNDDIGNEIRVTIIASGAGNPPAFWQQWGAELIEESAIQQMKNACTLPCAVRGALMPDAQPRQRFSQV